MKSLLLLFVHNLFQIFPYAQVVPAEAGQILDHDAVNLASLDLRHHLMKGRTVKRRR